MRRTKKSLKLKTNCVMSLRFSKIANIRFYQQKNIEEFAEKNWKTILVYTFEKKGDETAIF